MSVSEIENQEPEKEAEEMPEVPFEAETESAPETETGAESKKTISVKSFVAILVAVCLAFGAVIGVIVYRNKKDAQSEQNAPGHTSQTDSADAGASEGLDFAAMRAAHADDEVVMTVDGSEVKWSEYFYWLSYNTMMLQNYIGPITDWDMMLTDTQTVAQYICDASEESCRQYHSLEKLAKDNGIMLTPEDKKTIAEQRAADIAGFCGEGATEEDFAEYLAQVNMTPEIYDYITNTYQLYQSGFAQLYGEEGENCPTELIMEFLTENEFMNASHILFLTTDTATGQPLDEETAAAKLEQANALVEELRTIEDHDELVARFAELKAELCEDSGKTEFPNGYVFTPGTMVPEFEDGVLALADYEVSEPIKSSYGYHIILRLPLDIVTPDTVVDLQYGYTAQYIAAVNKYAMMGEEYFTNSVVKYMPAFEGFSIADIVK